MRYVALLRGINVGGKNKVSMAELKLVFEQAGMSNVSTYINSGNVIFEATRKDKVELTKLLENGIKQHFGFAVKVIVWDKDSFLALAGSIPDDWVNDATMKCDVMFLWDEIDSQDIIGQLTLKPNIDNIKYVPGALLWSVARQNVTKSGLMRLVGTDIYKKMTIRNCNTIRKLQEILVTA